MAFSFVFSLWFRIFFLSIILISSYFSYYSFFFISLTSKIIYLFICCCFCLLSRCKKISFLSPILYFFFLTFFLSLPLWYSIKHGRIPHISFASFCFVSFSCIFPDFLFDLHFPSFYTARTLHYLSWSLLTTFLLPLSTNHRHPLSSS